MKSLPPMNKSEFKKKVSILSDKDKLKQFIDDTVSNLLNNNELIFTQTILSQYLVCLSEMKSEIIARKNHVLNRNLPYPKHIDETKIKFERYRAKNLLPNEIDLLEFGEMYLTLKIKNLKIEKESILIEEVENEKIEKLVAKIDNLENQINTSYDFNKPVLNREEACAYLSITDRALTTLLTKRKINPISFAAKPYTFAKKELDRYIESSDDV